MTGKKTFEIQRRIQANNRKSISIKRGKSCFTRTEALNIQQRFSETT